MSNKYTYLREGATLSHEEGDEIAAKIEKQEAALKAALEFLPEAQWEGGTEFGYYKRSGAALLEARRKVLEALK